MRVDETTRAREHGRALTKLFGPAAAVTLLLLLAACGSVAAPAPRPNNGAASLSQKAASGPDVIGFWAKGTDQTLSPLAQYPHAVSAFVPFFYSIAPTGTITSMVDATVLTQAQHLGLHIVPLFNTPGAQTFLGTAASRVRLAQQMASLVRTHHYQGVDLDFEPAEATYSTGLAAFVGSLHRWLPKGSSLYLDVVPDAGPAYDFPAMTPDLTAYVLMSYDEHDDGSVAGPVAATPWVTAQVQALLKKAPASKVDMGLAFYGYDWLNGTTNAATLGLNYIPSAAAAHETYDAESQEMHATYTDSTGSHVAWWETPEGLTTKLQNARKWKLHGVAVWRLGYQTAATLKLLQQYRANALAASGASGTTRSGGARSKTDAARGPKAKRAGAPKGAVRQRSARTMRKHPGKSGGRGAKRSGSASSGP